MMETIEKKKAQVRLKRYPAYKDSGVEWLGGIPEHWDVLSLGSLIELKSDKNHPDYEVLSVYREYGVIMKDSRDDNHNVTSENTSTYKAVEPGDLVVNKMKAWQGSMGISPFRGIVSPAYITCRVTSPKVVSAYLHLLLRHNSYIGEYSRLSYGVRVGQWDMHYEDFKKIPVLLPPVDEQSRIAEFLDRKTQQIDQAINQKERQIELLKERKQILIHNAVTRGLDPNVKLKDSGVEWIGEIPEHWAITKIKYYAKVFVPERAKPDLNAKKMGLPWVTTDALRNTELRDSDIEYHVDEISQRKTNSRVINSGSVLATCVGNFGIASKLNFDCIINQQIQGYTDLRIDAMFLVYLIKISEDYFKNHATMTTIMYVSKSIFGSMPITLPDSREQKQIVNFIDDNSRRIAKAITCKQREIEKLKEYKATLINAAVTGKIKV